jgi:hypothetical protein
MLSSIDIVVLFYFLLSSFIICIISLFLIRVKVIKDIEERYFTKLSNPFYRNSSFAKCFDVADYIFYLYLVELNI